MKNIERENKKLEYKESIDTETYLKTVSAFSNYDGGTIIFGIKDNLKIVGIKNPVDQLLKLEDKINGNIHPNPNFELSVDEIDNTITLKIKKGNNKPYYYKNKAYKRNDTSTIEVDSLELKRLVLEGENRSYDSTAIKLSTPSFKILEEKVMKSLNITRFDQDTLKTLQLYEKGEYNVAAGLLADVNNFPGIDCVRFGNDINTIVNRKVFYNISIISQFDQCMDFFREKYEIEIINGKKREKQQLIPEVAFREALANAIIHRTYDVDAHTIVKMYNNKIEITSPGSLLPSISKDEFLNGSLSILRNPIIGNIFNRLNFIERLGTGINRINDSYKEYILKPSFYVNDNSIKVELPTTDKQIYISKEEQLVLDILSKAQVLSREEIDKYVHLGKAKLIRVLNSMVDKTILIREGNNKSIRYKIR